MEPVVTSAEMHECDRIAVETLRIPSLALMENAGRGVAELLSREFDNLRDKEVLVICGKGNNGGDGFVLARHLLNCGCYSKVVLVGKPSELKGDAKANFLCLKHILKRLPDKGRLKILEIDSASKVRMLPTPDIIVDALFGTGFKGEVRQVYREIIEWINSSPARKISVDVPSGLNADNGRVENVAVAASITATMGLRKIGLITGKGRAYAGRIEVIDIGIPDTILREVGGDTCLMTREDVRKLIPQRAFNAHKHSVGKILVIAGSKGLTGAAAMTSVSAMRSGAGAVILAVPETVYPILAKKLTEVMVIPLQDTGEGTLGLGAYEQLREQLEWADVVILGPGLSRDPETEQLVWRIVDECGRPMVIDADGLNALAKKMSVLRKRTGREIVLTPHTGELSRLTAIPSTEIEHDRVSIARRIAKELRLTLVLKGAPTVTAGPDGMVVINSSGNPGMATAGSGDVLAGVIGALWAQGANRNDAACTGVYVHGVAGDMAKEKYGEKSLLATDIQEFLPKVLRGLALANDV